MKNKMRKRYVIYLVLGVIFTFVLALSIGTVRISPVQVIQMLRYDLGTVREVPEEAVRTIFFQIRLPRVLLAFCVGCALSVSGVLMQSVLKNSLASSYTLGVSSGAALGASLAILGNFTFFGTFTLSFCGMSAGIVTVILAVVVAQKLDHSMENTTIILTGMAFSLFANAMISFIISIAGESVQQIIFWQMGSFALKNWTHLFWIFPVTFLGILLSLFFSREMDVMTLGEEQAKATGVSIVKMKWLFLLLAAILTGCAVSVVGVIGFVDLFTPHVARKLFGAKHRLVLPASAVIGGIFMVLCDFIARSIAPPRELPVGAVTSLIGAPFFIYLYFDKKRKY